MRILIVTLAASACLTSAACQRRDDADPRTLPTLVAVTQARPAESDAGAFTGVVRARVESDLGFRIGGTVIERFVDAGQSVRKGQALMRLDLNDVTLNAKALSADVAAAKARSVQTKAELQRLDGLVQRGAISADAYDQAKAAADSADAAVAAAVAQADVAANAIRYATLTADSDGVIQITSAEPGQVVSAGQVVVKLAHAGPREADVSLPETLRPALKAKAQAEIYGQSGARFTAILRQLSQSADPATRTFDARFVLDGAGAQAPLGATVTLHLPVADAGVTEAPLGAIYDPGSGPGVWQVTNNRVTFRKIKPLSLGAESVRVAGLPRETIIVAAGADRLREGQAVRTLPLSSAGL